MTTRKLTSEEKARRAAEREAAKVAARGKLLAKVDAFELYLCDGWFDVWQLSTKQVSIRADAALEFATAIKDALRVIGEEKVS